ncbi:hypothetical protein [Bacillus sp. REN16]|uniref:hypothetical protein n=1 Tax=Bacillus sp. REN16 TaxID=2887296 RepID=UPI001E536AB8|nr:hypothetical protein [Bacillus sp. REN16]MCC3358212.1 hypothetical protein [Bacillus sp. REN16]
MVEKGLSEQEWIHNYLQGRGNPLPLVLGTRGTWGINGETAIILVAFTMPDIEVLRDIHNATMNPIRKMKYRGVTYFAVNILDREQVINLIEEWK